jgi:hypothetical protein
MIQALISRVCSNRKRHIQKSLANRIFPCMMKQMQNYYSRDRKMRMMRRKKLNNENV